MAMIQWSDRYSIGIPSIDEQHQQLVGYINQLNKAMATGDSSSEVMQVLAGLIDYTKFHFRYEETLFAEHGFSDAKAHSLEHAKLINQIKQFRINLEQDPGGSISLELMQFLKGWLIHHIQGSDKAYAEELLKKGVI